MNDDVSTRFSKLVSVFTSRVLDFSSNSDENDDVSKIEDALLLYDLVHNNAAEKLHRPSEIIYLYQQISSAFKEAVQKVMDSVGNSVTVCIHSVIRLYENFCDLLAYFHLLKVPLHQPSILQQAVDISDEPLSCEFGAFIAQRIKNDENYISTIITSIESAVMSDFPNFPHIFSRMRHALQRGQDCNMPHPSQWVDGVVFSFARKSMGSALEGLLSKHVSTEHDFECWVQVITFWHAIYSNIETLLPKEVQLSQMIDTTWVGSNVTLKNQAFCLKSLCEFCFQRGLWKAVNAILHESSVVFFGNGDTCEKVQDYLHAFLVAHIGSSNSRQGQKSLHSLHILEILASMEKATSHEKVEQRCTIAHCMQNALEKLFTSDILEYRFHSAFGHQITYHTVMENQPSIPFHLLRHHTDFERFCDRHFALALYRILHSPLSYREHSVLREREFLGMILQNHRGTKSQSLSSLSTVLDSLLLSKNRTGTSSELNNASLNPEFWLMQSPKSLLGSPPLINLESSPNVTRGLRLELQELLKSANYLMQMMRCRLQWTDSLSTGTVAFLGRNGPCELILSARDALIAKTVHREKEISLPDLAGELGAPVESLFQSDLIQRIDEEGAFFVSGMIKGKIQLNSDFIYSDLFVENLYLRFVTNVCG